MKMIGGFNQSPNFLLVLSNAIDDRDVCFVGNVVQPQIVELKEDSKFVGAQKFLAEPRADLVGVEDELACASLTRRDGFNLIGENQGARVEFVVFKVRHTEGGIEHAEVATQSVFDDKIKAIKAGTERNGFLIDRREIQRRLEKRLRKITGDYIL